MSVVMSVFQLVSNRRRIALIGLTLIRFRDIGVLKDYTRIYITSLMYFLKEYLFEISSIYFVCFLIALFFSNFPPAVNNLLAVRPKAIVFKSHVTIDHSGLSCIGLPHLVT